MNHISNDINPCNFKQSSFYTPSEIIDKSMQNSILSKLLLVWSGVYIKAHGHFVNNRITEDYILIYCVSGKGWLTLDSRTWQIKAGDIFVCPPNMPHSYGADSEEPWTKYWAHFRGETAEDYIQLLKFTTASPVQNIGNNIKLISWFEDIFEILKTGYSQSNLLLSSSYLSNILAYLNTISINNTFINKNDIIDVENVITYMLDNLDKSLTLDDLSDFANITKYHFTRIFKEKTGYPPVEYYTRLKIQKACELLELSDLKISQISFSLGFQTPYYFSTVFKKIIGKSPKQYRAGASGYQ
ncbi:AraC family transcriptional regulator [Anaerosporobacter sp.]|uniref:AraC family transcriptional regulator n=1 Tax=Anaerosporobacter sp. TaxID=1872529 RepID=UPI00286F3872|nr:AraC family transcriptional regulator [Anaerosporobacter sp.]